MYKVVVLTISDKCSAGQREDVSGRIIQDMIKDLPAQILQYSVVSDDSELIKEQLIEYCDGLKADLVLTTGGTGFSSRDNTPEATLAIVEKVVPGIPELIRAEGFKKTPRAILSRGVAGLRKKTLIINLPGSPQGAKESLEVIFSILTHGIDMVQDKKH